MLLEYFDTVDGVVNDGAISRVNGMSRTFQLTIG